MDRSTRRFTLGVLLIHSVLLIGVFTTVFFAAREVYRNARRQAIEQASRVQELLAAQTARGIQGHYDSIVDSFQLLWDTDFSEQGPGAAARAQFARERIGPGLWRQLKNRASQFLVINRAARRIAMSLPEEQSADRAAVLRDAAGWIDSVKLASISDQMKINDEFVNLVGVPMRDQSQILFVAVVPIKVIDTQFLQPVHAEQKMSAVLLDQNMRVLTAFEPSIIGMSVTEQGSDPAVRALAAAVQSSGKGGTHVLEKPFHLGTHEFESGIISLHPIDMFGRRWWLSIGSTLSDVDAIVQGTLRRTIGWGLVVALLVAAILISTAIQMIRIRLRGERLRHEILTKELTQARKIQLAWLPHEDDDPPNIDLSAVNLPASHVSGDFYNWFELRDGRTCVVIGDVTGHGMAATFLMATTQLLVRTTMPRVMDAGKCLEEINAQLCQQMFNGQFVTMLIVVLDRKRGKIEVATAGHPAPLVTQRDGQFEPLNIEPELVLGVEVEARYPTAVFDLPPGARLVLYTDGVVDAQALDNRRFKLDGLRECLVGHFANAREMAQRVTKSIETFSAGRTLADDLTLVTVQLDASVAPESK